MKYEDISFKGILASRLGVVVTKQVGYIRPKEVVETIKIPGRDGMVTIAGSHSYDEVAYAPMMAIKPNSDMESIRRWLRGTGEIVFGSMQEWAFDGNVYEQFDFMPSFDTPNDWVDIAPVFMCHPLRKKVIEEEDIIVGQSGSMIMNIGSVPSKPIITVTGVTEITLAIGGMAVDLHDMPNGESIVMNSEVQDAFNGDMTALVNHKMQGDFITLPVGGSMVTYTAPAGQTPIITIKPNWRWL